MERFEGPRFLIGTLLAALSAPLFLSATPARGGGAESVPWRQDLRAARGEAAASGRAVWLQLTGPWCPSCERMERDTFPHPWIVARARAAFVPVKLRTDVHEELISYYGITGIPATLILDPAGQVIARNEGYLEPARFAAFLDAAAGRHRMLVQSRTPRPVPRPVATAEPQLALAGYCPVSLVDGRRLVSGQPAVALDHAGRTYRFADREQLERFQLQPERFIPFNSGLCPVAQIDRGEVRAGNPRHCVLYLGHLYLCANEPSRQLFLKSPERYARVDVAERQLCPHCVVGGMFFARNSGEALVVRDGSRRFWPGSGYLEALRTDPEGTTRR